MAQASDIEIFIHVGTGKTGTKFIQYRVFPKLQGIHYIQRTKYKRAVKLIQARQHQRYLVSNEFDQQLEHEVQKFSQAFPQAKPIIVFRRHDSYIASQYRRFVKNGETYSFTEFFDLEKDAGHFKKQDLDYMRQIGLLEKYFPHHRPLVLIYDELRKDPRAFIERITRHLGVTIDFDSINFKKKHTSYSEQQLKSLMRMGKYLNMRKRRITKIRPLHYLFKFYLEGTRYAILYLSKWFGKKSPDQHPLIDPQELAKVEEYYREDWEKCKEYAQSTVLES